MNSAKKSLSSLNTAGSTQQRISRPHRSVTMRPAYVSSLMWCETVDGAMLSSPARSPTQRPMLSAGAQVGATVQHPAKRQKICRRCG